MDGNLSNSSPRAGNNLYFGVYSRSDSFDSVGKDGKAGNQQLFKHVSSLSGLSAEPIMGGSRPDRNVNVFQQVESAGSAMGSAETTAEGTNFAVGTSMEEEPELICEECEKAPATLHCTACVETLCDKCSSLLHLVYSNGEPHEHVRENKLRKPKRGDRGALSGPEVDRNLLPDYEVDEAAAAALGWDLARPRALEAPRPAAVAAAGALGAAPRFQDGDRVLFALAAAAFEDEAGAEEAPATGWRGQEAHGTVLGGPLPRHGQWAAAYRRGSNNEHWYRVRLEAYASREYDEVAEYERQKEAAAFRGVTLQGRAAPMVRERQRAVALDARLRAAREKKVPDRRELAPAVRGDRPPPPGTARQEGGGGEGGAGPGRRVLLLPEGALRDPVAAYRDLRARRRRFLRTLLEGADWHTSMLLVYLRFKTWHGAVQHLIFLERSAAALVIQTQARVYLARRIVEFLWELEAVRARERWEDFHAPYRYVWDPEDQKTAYTVDGIHFLPTRSECNTWTRMWMTKTKRMWELHVRADTQSAVRAWRRWRAQVPDNPVVSSDEEEEEEDEQEGGSRRNSTESWGSVTAVLAKKLAHPWHPALGMALPPLEKIWARRNPSGQLDVENYPKFNSFRAHMAGPTDTSNWLVPGLLLMGAYPEGKARRLDPRSLVHPYQAAVEQILLARTSTFVCLMTQEELDETEAQLGVERPLKEAMEDTYEICRAYLQTSLVAAKNELFKTQQEVKHAPRFLSHDLRFAEAENNLRKLRARERVCLQGLERIKRALVRYPMTSRFIHFPMKDDDAPPAEKLIKFLLYLETLVRDKGEALYVFSRLGHGRAGLVAGALLARLYGLAHEACLERLQICHDARPLIKDLGQKISCPQTVAQVAALREILRGTDVLYSDLKKTTGLPNADERREVIRRRRRGAGVPKESQTVELLRVVAPDDAALDTDSDPDWEQEYARDLPRGGFGPPRGEAPADGGEDEEEGSGLPAAGSSRRGRRRRGGKRGGDEKEGEEEGKKEVHHHDATGATEDPHRNCRACHRAGFKHDSSESEIESDVQEEEEAEPSPRELAAAESEPGRPPPVLLGARSRPTLRTLRGATAEEEHARPKARHVPARSRFSLLRRQRTGKMGELGPDGRVRVAAAGRALDVSFHRQGSKGVDYTPQVLDREMERTGIRPLVTLSAGPSSRAGSADRSGGDGRGSGAALAGGSRGFSSEGGHDDEGKTSRQEQR